MVKCGDGDMEDKVIRQIGNVIDTGRDNPSAGRVYDQKGLSPTLGAMQGGHRQPMIVECAAMRGRGENNEQQLEIRSDECTNSITTVQKDNMVLIRQATKDGVIPCEVGGGMRSELSRQQDKTRKSAREWSDMPDSDNGEYP